MSRKVALLGTFAAFFIAGCENDPSVPTPKDVAAAVIVTVETTPMLDPGGVADDPAIWVNSTAPVQSLIIATNKVRGLAVYDLLGRQVAARDDGTINNVDLRQDVSIADFRGNIVAASNREKKSSRYIGLTGLPPPLHLDYLFQQILAFSRACACTGAPRPATSTFSPPTPPEPFANGNSPHRPVLWKQS